MSIYGEYSGKIFHTDLSAVAATYIHWRLPGLGSGVAITSPRDWGTWWWQPSATSLCPTLHSKSWMTCPTSWASTLGNPAKFVTIVLPIQTTFATMITHISFTAILLNPLRSSCNRLRSGNICRMLQARNSMMLQNVSTERWNQATGGEMNSYVSWISW